ncbi:LOW QUALITY PROTEIN: hypothetical protein U9M48_001196 [Paspalum notatum var. saurae]|uniref:Uncharacterized protein n=1 Tax=Paspalum notatum var. saurae TaxID=547442 RepID=A0AAQ3PLJ4_PASNO
MRGDELPHPAPSPKGAKPTSEDPWRSTSATREGGRDANTWSCVRSTASAARGDDTTSTGIAPRRSSMRSWLCFLARHRRET